MIFSRLGILNTFRIWLTIFFNLLWIYQEKKIPIIHRETSVILAFSTSEGPFSKLISFPLFYLFWWHVAFSLIRIMLFTIRVANSNAFKDQACNLNKESLVLALEWWRRWNWKGIKFKSFRSTVMQPKSWQFETSAWMHAHLPLASVMCSQLGVILTATSLHHVASNVLARLNLTVQNRIINFLHEECTEARWQLFLHLFFFNFTIVFQMLVLPNAWFLNKMIGVCMQIVVRMSLAMINDSSGLDAQCIVFSS